MHLFEKLPQLPAEPDWYLITHAQALFLKKRIELHYFQPMPLDYLVVHKELFTRLRGLGFREVLISWNEVVFTIYDYR